MTNRKFQMSLCVAVMIGAAALASAQSTGFVSSFDQTNGQNPTSGVTMGPDGDFYGTTSSQYGTSFGTVYRVTPRGVITTLYQFCAQVNCADGAYPVSGLTLASDGNFYGTTNGGGDFNVGTVFRIATDGTLTTLYSFCAKWNCADGNFPVGGMVAASDGKLYGTTTFGGATNYGTVFAITLQGRLETLHSFCAQTTCADGSVPFGTLVQGRDGALYGTTSAGGAHGDYGTAFRLARDGAFRTLYSFCARARCADGKYPYAGLIQGTDGNFYGTAENGGANLQQCNKRGCGTMFAITSGGKLTILHSFCVKPSCEDGQNPMGSLLQAKDGNFYGTTAFAGEYGGVIFRYSSAGKYNVLDEFNDTNGNVPEAGLVQGPDGLFYGTTFYGGWDGVGAVFGFALGK